MLTCFFFHITAQGLDRNQGPCLSAQIHSAHFLLERRVSAQHTTSDGLFSAQSSRKINYSYESPRLVLVLHSRLCDIFQTLRNLVFSPCVCARLSSAERDAGQLPREALADGSRPGGGAAGPQGDSPGVQHRPARLRGRGRRAVVARPRRRDAAGARGPHRRRHPLCHRGLAH